jgi:hypothetical protein
MRWQNGKVATEDSVAMPATVSGKTLRDAYWANIEKLTFGLVRTQHNSLFLGRLELMDFGPPAVTRNGVTWPIEGGLLVRARGGRLRFESLPGRLVALVDDYEPSLPRILYALTQLPIHSLWTRLHLLRVRGRLPAPGPPAEPSRRLAAGAIDAAFCIALAAAVGRRRRVAILVGIAAGYHVACWTTSGRTLGGAVMNQRVVAADGSALTAGQAIVRLIALPLAVLRKNIHDQIAGTDVVAL